MSPAIISHFPRILILGMLSPLAAHALPPCQPVGRLVAQAEPQLLISPLSTADFDCGRINLLDTREISHLFTVRNEGVTPLTITQLQTTCHCTIAVLEEVAGLKTSVTEQPFFVLEPGQDARIRMTVQLARQIPGRVTQSTFIYADGFNNPITTLRLLCTLDHGLAPNPASIDLGPIKLGETCTRQFTLTYDPRLVSGTGLPSLATQADPHIPSSTESFLTVAPINKPAASPTSPGLLTQTFTLTIKPAHPGDLVARIYFPEIARADHHSNIPFETAAEVFRALVIPVLAHVDEK